MSSSTSNGRYHVEIRDSRGVVIGDNNVIYQTFSSERFAPLTHKLITFTTLIEERTQDFVGREFIVAAIENFLAEYDRGYFVIEGEPGIGKTALTAFLVQTRGYVHHFVVSALGIIRHNQFLENVSAQLIARYGLDRDYIPPEAGRDGAYFSSLLEEVSRGLEAGEQVVIMVDALDEALRPEVAQSNVLYLPSILPKGIYFILTRRPGDLDLTCPDTPREVYTLAAESEGNQLDVRAYLQNITNREAIKEQLEQASVTTEDFIRILATKSRGNFMYLHHVIRAIEKHKYSPLEPVKLPDGLANYYERALAELQSSDPESWLGLYQPVLGILAVVKAPVTRAQISTFLEMDTERADLALRRLREYLHIDEERYRIYHARFRDFLEDHLVNPQRYHRIVIARYTTRQGFVLHSELTPEEREYALQFLSGHLFETGNYDLLYRFVEDEEWLTARESYGTTGFYLIHDLEVALQAAKSKGTPSLPRSISYGLVYSSISAQADNLPPNALKALAMLDQIGKALGLTSLIKDPAHRFQAYWQVAMVSRDSNRSQEAMEILDYATAAAHQIREKAYRAHAFAELARAWSEYGQVAKARRTIDLALQAWDRVSEDFMGTRARVLAEIVNACILFDIEQSSSLLKQMRGDWFIKAKSRAKIAARIVQGRSLEEALGFCDTIVDRYERSLAYTEIAETLLDMHQVEDALAVAQYIGSSIAQTDLLLTIAEKDLETGDADRALRLAAEVESKVETRWHRSPVETLADLVLIAVKAGASSDEVYNKVTHALENLRGASGQTRACSLAKLAIALSAIGAKDESSVTARSAIEAACSIEDRPVRVEVLFTTTEMLCSIDEEIALSAVEKALAAVNEMPETHLRALRLLKVAEIYGHLEQRTQESRLIRQAIEMVETIDAANWMTAALTEVSLALIDLNRTKWATSLIDRVVKISSVTTEVDPQIEYIRRLGLDAQQSDISSTLVPIQTREAHWHVKALSNLAIALSRANHLDAATEAMTEAMRSLETQWLDVDGLKHAVEGLTFVHNDHLLAMAKDCVSKVDASKEDNVLSRCRLEATLAVIMAQTKENQCGVEETLKGVFEWLRTARHHRVPLLATIIRRVAYAGTITGDIGALRACLRKTRMLSDKDAGVGEELFFKLAKCIDLVKQHEGSRCSLGKAARPIKEEVRSIWASTQSAYPFHWAAFPPDSCGVGVFPYRYTTNLELGMRVDNIGMHELKKELEDFESQVEVVEENHINHILRSKMSEIFEIEERDVRAYGMNAFFDTLFDMTRRSAIDILRVTLETFEKARESSRADVWVLITAASPIIESQEAMIALWESMEPLVKWWRLQ